MNFNSYEHAINYRLKQNHEDREKIERINKKIIVRCMEIDILRKQARYNKNE